VSHDRRFLDNVVTQTLVAEGDGVWREYPGGYSDWLVQRRSAPAPAAVSAAPRPSSRTDGKPRTRLSYKDQRELAGLPDEIEGLERELADLTERMAGPGYHLAGAESMRADRSRLKELEELIAAKLARWEQLEGQAS
jgi:ATP-binding cassette subfamily F protein uup